jgi:stage V sporulation protein G
MYNRNIVTCTKEKTSLQFGTHLKKQYCSIIRRPKMQITDIKIRKVFDDGPMKAVVSVTFDGQLAVHDVKVINARDKFFIVMPSRQNPDGSYRDIVHPINADFRNMLEREVIAAYEAELEALANQPAEEVETV